MRSLGKPSSMADMSSASPAGGAAGGPPGQARRQQVVDALCEAFARDEMPIEDFERRVETAHRTETSAELEALLADLPSPAQLARMEGRPGAALGPRGGQIPSAGGGAARARDVVAGIMGGSARRGRWVAARQITALGIMGGAELDFREAVLQPGVTEVHAFAFWGGVEILVPPHVRLESSGIGIMGGFDSGEGAAGPAHDPDPLAPVLRITGVALMGGVEISVRHAGESGREARKRVREERRQRRLGDGDRG
jgi:hypothetical protein